MKASIKEFSNGDLTIIRGEEHLCSTVCYTGGGCAILRNGKNVFECDNRFEMIAELVRMTKEMNDKSESGIILKAREDYYVWEYNHGQNMECLANTEIDFCDHCGKPATTNSVWIVNANDDNALNKMREQADKIRAKHGLLTELGADSEGSCFCEDCYAKHAIEE